MFKGLRYFFRWVLSAFGSRKDLVLENLALREQLLALHTRRPAPPTVFSAQAVLGCLEQALVWMAEASSPGKATNGNRLASGRLPVVLEMALTKSANGWTPADQQGDSRTDLSHGSRESNLGSTAHSR